MNANSIISLLQDKLPKDFTLLKMLENKLGTLDEKRLDELAQKIPILNLKSPIFVFWVRSFIFAALDINRFMTGQFQLKAQAIQRQTPIHSQFYDEANLAWSAKTSHFFSPYSPFYSHNQYDTLCSCKRYKRISAKNHQTNRSKQFYSWYFGCCRNHLMIAYLSSQQRREKQNLEKF